MRPANVMFLREIKDGCYLQGNETHSEALFWHDMVCGRRTTQIKKTEWG